jgi:hypothetical protein
MKTLKYNIRGTEMNKMQFSELESYLEEKNININEAFDLMADENEYVYVSNGFIRGLLNEENENGEWHHFFKKDVDGNFEAGKLKFL